MPITPFLSGHAFQPEVINVMSDVLLRVQDRLGLSDRDDPLNQIVASKIIELAQRGIVDPETLLQRTLQESARLGVSLSTADNTAGPVVTPYHSPIWELAGDPVSPASFN